MKERLHLKDIRRGLGDALYNRPFVREAARDAEVWLETLWPQLYRDILGLRFTPVGQRTRGVWCSDNNASLHAELYEEAPADAREIRLNYPWELMERKGMFRAIAEATGITPRDWSMRMGVGPRPAVAPSEPYAFVRPAVERVDWATVARNPDPLYIERSVEVLRSMGYLIVTTADLRSGETMLGNPLQADLELHHGELEIFDLLSLMKHAAVAVVPHGFAVAAAMVTGTPTVVVAGGWGAYDNPRTLAHPTGDSDRMRWVLPDLFCRCRDKRHRCNKRIRRFRTKLRAQLDDLGVGEHERLVA